MPSNPSIQFRKGYERIKVRCFTYDAPFSILLRVFCALWTEQIIEECLCSYRVFPFTPNTSLFPYKVSFSLSQNLHTCFMVTVVLYIYIFFLFFSSVNSVFWCVVCVPRLINSGLFCFCRTLRHGSLCLLFIGLFALPSSSLLALSLYRVPCLQTALNTHAHTHKPLHTQTITYIHASHTHVKKG